MVGGHAGAEPVPALHHGWGAVDLPPPHPPAVGHALDGGRGIGVVVGVAVGHDDAVGVPRVGMDAVHLGHSPWAGVHVDAPAVVVYEHPAGAAHLGYRGVATAAGPQEGYPEHVAAPAASCGRRRSCRRSPPRCRGRPRTPPAASWGARRASWTVGACPRSRGSSGTSSPSWPPGPGRTVFRRCSTPRRTPPRRWRRWTGWRCCIPSRRSPCR